MDSKLKAGETRHYELGGKMLSEWCVYVSHILERNRGMESIIKTFRLFKSLHDANY